MSISSPNSILFGVTPPRRLSNVSEQSRNRFVQAVSNGLNPTRVDSDLQRQLLGARIQERIARGRRRVLERLVGAGRALRSIGSSTRTSYINTPVNAEARRDSLDLAGQETGIIEATAPRYSNVFSRSTTSSGNTVMNGPDGEPSVIRNAQTREFEPAFEHVSSSMAQESMPINFSPETRRRNSTDTINSIIRTRQVTEENLGTLVERLFTRRDRINRDLEPDNLNIASGIHADEQRIRAYETRLTDLQREQREQARNEKGNQDKS
jgi:hypothetical protein